MSTAKEFLQKTRDLLAKGWTTGVFARDARGIQVEPYDPDAVCFCTIGALQLISVTDQTIQRGERDRAYTLLSDIRHEETPHLPSFSGFNDNSTQEEVLAWFDKAIERAP